MSKPDEFAISETKGEPEITKDEPKIIKDELKITKDEPKITKDELKITKDELKITKDELKTTKDELKIQLQILKNKMHIKEAEIELEKNILLELRQNHERCDRQLKRTQAIEYMNKKAEALERQKEASNAFYKYKKGI